jgi:hypothetical protein
MEDKIYEDIGVLTEDGSALQLSSPGLWRRFCSHLIGKDLKITFTPYRKIRTQAQNRYIHGVVVPVVQQWKKDTEGKDYTHDTIYTWLRCEIVGDTIEIDEVIGINGDIVQVPVLKGKRFSKMTTKEFADAVNLIVDTLGTMGCFIPLPRENNLLRDFIDSNTLDDK